jgi:hypothetical protein
MIKCQIEDNNKEQTWRVYFVVNLKSHNYFFMIQTTNERRKCFRHNVIGTSYVPDIYKRNTKESCKQNT